MKLIRSGNSLLVEDNGGDPNAEATLNAIERWLGRSLPPSYCAYVLDSARTEFTKKEMPVNGGGITADVILYPPKDLISKNESLDTKTYCPEYIAIGIVRGGGNVLISLNGATTDVFCAPRGPLNPRSFQVIRNIINLIR